MAGQYRFKDINGNIVAQISASAAGAISFSGSAVDFSNASTITLGEVQLAGTASNALLLDGFDSTAFVFTSSFNTISSSVSSDLLNLKSKSSSVDISISNINTFTASNGNTSLNSYTASNDTKFTTLGSYTGSNDTKWTSISNVTSSLIQVTGSYATTGSNTFKGTQIVSASMYVQGDFVVFGSSSIQYISASSVSIGTNIVQLNTNQPAVRFGGLSVQDSGSAVGVTGSMFWDGCCNRWIYSNPSGVGYSGGVLMSGPRGSTLGNEPTLTCNYIAKSGGGDHLYDSCIIDNGTNICFNTPTGSFNGVVQINTNCNIGGGILNLNGDLKFGGTGGQNYCVINYQGGCLQLGTNNSPYLTIGLNGSTTLSCQLYLDGCNRDNVFVKSNNTSYSRLFYAGNNQIIFHNGNTTACGGAWGLNNYEDTVGLFRVYNSGISCWYGNKLVCGNIGLISTCSKFYQQTNNCKSADSVLDIYNTATDGFGVSIQAGANNNNYALTVSNYLGTSLLHVAGNGFVGIGCGTPNAKLTINSGDCISSIRIYGCNSSYISQIGWYDSTNVYPSADSVGGQRVALIEIGTVAGTGTGCRGANMGLYTHEANGSLKLPLLLMHNGNVCLPQGNLYTTCTLFAPGTPIQVVTGNATVSSGAQGTGVSMGTNETGGSTPLYNQGLNIAQTTFTPKSATSKILIMTNSVVMWERSNVSDHFYLWAANHTDGTILVKSGQYLNTFGPGGQNGGIISLNGAASSWGTSTKTIIFRIGTTGSSGAYYEWNPYYGVSGFNADTVGNFTWTIMEIAQ